MDKIEILSTKTFTGNPADGIDNFTSAVFKRISPMKLSFHIKAPKAFKEIGSLKKLQISRINYLISQKPDYLWGMGNIRDLLLLLLRPRKTKYIINFHTILIKNKGPWRVKTPWPLRNFIFSKADLVICPSEFSAKSVGEYFPNKKIIAILNGVDLKLFAPEKRNPDFLREKYKINFSQPIVVFIGAFVPRKRPDLFIELAKKFGEINFVAIGRVFPEYDFLSSAENLINFQWIEKMPREDIAILLASAKIFIFPSLNEPSAAVILEAMASGCVPIISKSGGSPEFFNGSDCGFLIDNNEGEIEEFAGKIRMLIKNESLRQKISMSARKQAENHSWEDIFQKYEEVLTGNL